MTSAFYSKAQGVVVAFDVTQRSSFDALQSWIRDVRQVYQVLIFHLLFLSLKLRLLFFVEHE
jgi:GTPase SAR1 family protein